MDELPTLEITSSFDDVWNNELVGIYQDPEAIESKLELVLPPHAATKAATWVYLPPSTDVNNSISPGQLLCRRDVVVPLVVKVNPHPTFGCYLAVASRFADAEHTMNSVQRCPNHCDDPAVAGALHLITSDSPSVHYRSTVAGELYLQVPCDGTNTSVPLRFMCFSSCPGGPGRRRLLLALTLLDQSGRALAHVTAELKVCASPGRDVKFQGCKKRKPQTGRDEVFTLEVVGRERYDVMTAFLDLLESSPADSPMLNWWSVCPGAIEAARRDATPISRLTRNNAQLVSLAPALAHLGVHFVCQIPSLTLSQLASLRLSPSQLRALIQHDKAPLPTSRHNGKKSTSLPASLPNSGVPTTIEMSQR